MNINFNAILYIYIQSSGKIITNILMFYYVHISGNKMFLISRLIFRVYCNYLQCSPKLLYLHTYPSSLVCPHSFFPVNAIRTLDLCGPPQSWVFFFGGIFKRHISGVNVRPQARTHIVSKRLMSIILSTIVYGSVLSPHSHHCCVFEFSVYFKKQRGEAPQKWKTP